MRLREGISRGGSQTLNIGLRQLDLFWIGMGTEDGGYENAKRLSEFLEDSSIEHTFREIPGAHTWIVWRKFLHEMAPQLWPDEM